MRPRLIVAHRHRLSAADVERIKGWPVRRESAAAPALVLCVSPYVRYDDLERRSGLADLVLSEATAAERLPFHVARLLERPNSRPSRPNGADRPAFHVMVASGNYELGAAVAEACAGAGIGVEQVGDVIMQETAGPPPGAASRAGAISDDLGRAGSRDPVV